MKLNIYQQAEVNSHNDAELLWVVQSTIESFKEDKSNFKEGNFNRFSLYKKIGVVITDVIAEREGFNDKIYKLTENEAANCLWNSYVKKFNNTTSAQEWKNWDELVVPFMDLLIYTALLRTRTPLQRSELIQEYWPFGQDGGFCNPNKLSMIND